MLWLCNGFSNAQGAMFHFATDHSLYRRSGLALLLFQLAVFVWSLPPFQSGIWLQTEPIVCVMLGCAALTAIWFACGFFKGWVTAHTRPHPLWLIQLAWLGWQMLATVAATSPWRSWFGPPQTGDGTALSLSLFLITLLASALWEVASFRRAIIGTMLATLLAQGVLHTIYYQDPDYTYHPDRWAPAQWPEYLGFMVAYVWLALFAGERIESMKAYLTLLVFTAFLLFVSWNKTAIALFVPVLILSMAMSWLPLPKHIQKILVPGKKWRIAAMLACVLPMAMVPASGWVSLLEPYAAENHIAALLTAKSDGIGARLVMNQVAISTMRHEPDRWLLGDGWGRYTDDLFKYALVDGVYVFHEGNREPNWFLVDGSSYHSHSQPLEALLSLGLTGMLLWYALPLMLLWFLPAVWFWPCAPMLVALTMLGHFWMQLPQCLVYQGVALALLLAHCTGNTQAAAPARRRVYTAALLCVALVMAWSAYGQWSAMRYGETLQEALHSGSHEGFSEEWLAQDFARGGDRWLSSVSFYSKEASVKAAKKEADGNMLVWYSDFLHTAHQASVNPKMGARVSAMELRLQYYLFGGFDDPIFTDLRHEATHEFENAVIRITHKAPLRDDYTTFFLLNLSGYTHDDIEREKKILTRMLLVAPDNRGALWLLGFIMSKTTGSEEEGLAMMKKAAQMHVENIFPVTGNDLAPFK